MPRNALAVPKLVDILRVVNSLIHSQSLGDWTFPVAAGTTCQLVQSLCRQWLGFVTSSSHYFLRRPSITDTLNAIDLRLIVGLSVGLQWVCSRSL